LCCQGQSAAAQNPNSCFAQHRTFTEAAATYRQLWTVEGSTIAEAMERGSGLTFEETHVMTVIFEGVSRSRLGDTLKSF
jgi:hypothetical protein